MPMAKTTIHSNGTTTVPKPFWTDHPDLSTGDKLEWNHRDGDWILTPADTDSDPADSDDAEGDNE